MFEKKGKNVLDDGNSDLYLKSHEMVTLLKDWDY